MRMRLLRGAAAAALPLAAHATDGYFAHGYGMKAKGMAGAVYRRPAGAFRGRQQPGDDGLLPATSSPSASICSARRAARSAAAAGAASGLDGSASSDSNYFGIPELGYNYMMRPDLSLGVTVYGNGGMNTDYPGGQLPYPGAAGDRPGHGSIRRQAHYNLFCGNGNLGVDLSQLVIAPTLAWKFHPDHAIGIAPLFAYQRFKMEGLQAFEAVAVDQPGPCQQSRL